MSETKDPAIKLFGKTIHLPLNEKIPALSEDGGGTESLIYSDPSWSNFKDKKSNNNNQGEEEEKQREDEDSVDGKPVERKEKDRGSCPIPEELTIPTASSGISDNPRTPSADKETALQKSSKTEEEHSETSNSEDKTLKKPDKILPCPRCNSMDTKFCYYNNYNVNQPRHFCKNCQRYWTAGGTMRNVPVGAGRRKNKNSAYHNRHLIVSEALQTAKTHMADGVAFKRNGTVLTFGSDSPLCESMASVLSLADQTMRNCTKNGFHGTAGHKIPDSSGGVLNDDENSSKCSFTASKSTEGSRVGLQESVMPNCHGFPPQIQCLPGSPWAFPWNSTQWNSSVPPPAFCASSFPLPFYPGNPYWGCPVPGNWSLPWLSPSSASPNSGAPASSPTSPSLGKHSREGDMLQQNALSKEDKLSQSNSERCLWTPKTSRINDPGEAARSSVWATLGIKNDMADPISGRGLFKAFQSKVDEKNHVMETSQVLQANPAALSRSLVFQENS